MGEDNFGSILADDLGWHYATKVRFVSYNYDVFVCVNCEGDHFSSLVYRIWNFIDLNRLISDVWAGKIFESFGCGYPCKAHFCH